MIISEQLKQEIKYVIDFIYENELEFIQKFFDSSNQYELVSISINDETLHFLIVTSSGHHIGSSCKISEFNNWVKEINYE